MEATGQSLTLSRACPPPQFTTCVLSIIYTGGTVPGVGDTAMVSLIFPLLNERYLQSSHMDAGTRTQVL